MKPRKEQREYHEDCPSNSPKETEEVIYRASDAAVEQCDRKSTGTFEIIHGSSVLAEPRWQRLATATSKEKIPKQNLPPNP
jgi:hypothetical protein